jgi:hypothetical protein
LCLPLRNLRTKNPSPVCRAQRGDVQRHSGGSQRSQLPGQAKTAIRSRSLAQPHLVNSGETGLFETPHRAVLICDFEVERPGNVCAAVLAISCFPVISLPHPSEHARPGWPFVDSDLGENFGKPRQCTIAFLEPCWLLRHTHEWKQGFNCGRARLHDSPGVAKSHSLFNPVNRWPRWLLARNSWLPIPKGYQGRSPCPVSA